MIRIQHGRVPILAPWDNSAICRSPSYCEISQAGRMEESGEDQLIATFQGVTGADVATAQHVLEAHAWDLNRSVEFFLEQSAAPVPQPGNLRAHAVSIDEAEEDDEGVVPTFTLPVPATRMQGSESPVQAKQSVPDHRASLLRDGGSHDDELHRALAESARDAELAHGEDHSDQAGEDAPTLLDSSDEDIAIVNERPMQPGTRAPMGNADGGASDPASARGLWGELEGVQRRQRRSRPRGAAAAQDQDLRELEAVGQHVGVPEGSMARRDPFAELMQGSAGAMPFPVPAMASAAAGPVLGNGRLASEDLQLPDGINVEEARMLEAAMLGIPYQARPSARSSAWMPAGPPAPEVVAGRQIRNEQDAAYQESLMADMEKAQRTRREQQEAAQAEQAKRNEQEAAEQAERDYERLISSKQANLPEEPPSNGPDTVSVMVRLPNGTRASRRFAAHQCLETLFDWVDITVAPDTRPGGYTLVTQYPRRQLQPQSAGTLHEAGLTEKQEALFLNMT